MTNHRAVERFKRLWSQKHHGDKHTGGSQKERQREEKYTENRGKIQHREICKQRRKEQKERKSKPSLQHHLVQAEWGCQTELQEVWAEAA